MENKDFIMLVVDLVLILGAFVLGRYVLPKSTKLQKAADDFDKLLGYAESFCAYARQFLTDLSGAEKMDKVVERLNGVCEQYGIELDLETLRAIAQKAYDAMIAEDEDEEKIVDPDQITLFVEDEEDNNTEDDSVSEENNN